MQDFITRKARPEVFRLKPYVPGKPIDEVKRELGLDDIIKMASNENPLGPCPKAVEAIKQVLDQLNIYPDSNCFQLKEKLARKLHINDEQIIIGNGSDEILMLIASAFVTPADEIIFCQPSFAEYEFTSTVMGGNMVAVPLKEDFSHDLDAILNSINEKTKLIYLCNPNNPTGNIVAEKDLDRFMEKVPADILVVIDEAYFEYANHPEYVSGLKYLHSGKPVMVLRTFSKIYGLAALRVGYGITSIEIAQAIQKVKEPFNVNMLAQVAACAALDDIEHLNKSKTVNLQGRKYLYDEFDKMGLSYVPTEANFVFVNVGKDSKEVFQALLKKGIIIRPGNIFGFPEYLRITIGTPEENERFIKGLQSVLS